MQPSTMHGIQATEDVSTTQFTPARFEEFDMAALLGDESVDATGLDVKVVGDRSLLMKARYRKRKFSERIPASEVCSAFTNALC